VAEGRDLTSASDISFSTSFPKSSQISYALPKLFSRKAQYWGGFIGKVERDKQSNVLSRGQLSKDRF